MSKTDVQKQILWMKVTLDEYELPLAVADTSRELERMLGLRKNAIIQLMWKAKKRNGKCSYITVEIDERSGEDG